MHRLEAHDRTMDELEHVEGLRRGDDAAWRSFLETHGGLILAVGARAGLDADERADLFQETCVACLRSLHTLRDTRRLGAWVYAIAYHLAIDHIRRQRLHRPADSDKAVQEARERVADPADRSGDTLAELERLEEVVTLRDQVAAMEPRCRDLLTLLYLVDPPLSYTEISRRAAIPIGSIGPTRTRCLGKLREMMNRLSNAPPSSSIRRSRARSDSGVGDLIPPSAGPRGPDQAGC